MPNYGGLGAAWASAISLCIPFLYRVVALKKKYDVSLDSKLPMTVILLLSLQTVALGFDRYVIQVVCFFAIIAIHRSTVLLVARLSKRWFLGHFRSRR